MHIVCIYILTQELHWEGTGQATSKQQEAQQHSDILFLKIKKSELSETTNSKAETREI